MNRTALIAAWLDPTIQNLAALIGEDPAGVEAAIKHELLQAKLDAEEDSGLNPISAPVNHAAAVSGSQNWRSWAVEPGAIDPARSEYIDGLLAKLRERQASRG